jgi:hypothetical protein
MWQTFSFSLVAFSPFSWLSFYHHFWSTTFSLESPSSSSEQHYLIQHHNNRHNETPYINCVQQIFLMKTTCDCFLSRMIRCLFIIIFRWIASVAAPLFLYQPISPNCNIIERTVLVHWGRPVRTSESTQWETPRYGSTGILWFRGPFKHSMICTFFINTSHPHLILLPSREKRRNEESVDD